MPQKIILGWSFDGNFEKFEKQTKTIKEINVEPAVNRQPGFRRELVEQKLTMFIFEFRRNIYTDAYNEWIPNQIEFSDFFQRNGNIIIFQPFLKRMLT